MQFDALKGFWSKSLAFPRANCTFVRYLALLMDPVGYAAHLPSPFRQSSLILITPLHFPHDKWKCLL